MKIFLNKIQKAFSLTCIILLTYSYFPVKVQAEPNSNLPSIQVAQSTSSSQVILNEFQPILAELSKKTQVPIVLPTQVPVSDFTTNSDTPPSKQPNGRKATFFPYILDVTSSGYLISLDLTPDCMGAGACDFGDLSAKKITSSTPKTPKDFVEYSQLYRSDPEQKKPPVTRSSQPPSRVKLTHGITGYFIPYVCGANCSNSSVVWDLNGYRYSVGIEMADKKTVVEMANSAIKNGAINKAIFQG